MDSIRELIRGDETYDKIVAGKCKICGKEYALITGSNRTLRKDGKRFAEVDCKKIGWDAFRCRGCKEIIEETWIPDETTSPTI
jgi:hypothetical protein